MPHERKHNEKISNPSDVFILFLSHCLSTPSACGGLTSFVCHQGSEGALHKLNAPLCYFIQQFVVFSNLIG